jgi:hypothetical protein
MAARVELISLKALFPRQGMLSSSRRCGGRTSMTNPDSVEANAQMVGEAKPASKGTLPETPAKSEFISDQCRLDDALEDDAVRELLKAGHRLERAATP